ncbi:3-oxoacyl-ACP synthase [Halopseudomonas oceani]|uniref:Ketoacyl-ACP synthase III n=1 Tax=Halopseudomonas oceani TaxID=1708783 RepID=A0A2P4EY03_9GAMM|nr:ketoacyl-ACP synthase III [Halopseudomonas oceani]POB05098.1 ketoacyl-ACP synthase III [Halopseudomonas oceani]GGE33124.1 3-oxoacyl-ACP synthase [Halopseudomonas oceani]
MIGVKAVASYIPEACIDNFEQASRFGEPESFVSNKIGAEKLPIKSDTEETSDLCVGAVRALQKKVPGFDLSAIDALVVVTQNGDGEGLPHTSAIVHAKLGLGPSVAAFDISLGCSGYVYGLHVLKAFMEGIGLENGLLLTADPYSKIVDKDDRNTAMLFGDAATATWMAHEPEWLLGKADFGTDGAGAEFLRTEKGRLHMNGRQIFNFASMNVPRQLKKVLAESGYTSADVDAYLLHQGSAAIIESISRRFGEDASKFVLDMGSTGNTVSSSVPLLLEKNWDRPWHRLVLCGFGVGLSWATTLLERADG